MSAPIPPPPPPPSSSGHGGGNRGKRPLIVANEEDAEEQSSDDDEPPNRIGPRQPRLNIGGPIQVPVHLHKCNECERTFAKPKALHGHMRCHPERDYRGISPMSRQRNRKAGPEKEVAKTMMLLGEGSGTAAAVADEKFECSGCKKVFGSRQALGGHRASHKNVPGCYAAERGEEEGEGGEGKSGGKKGGEEGMLKCGVCGRVFVNPQGLGAHRRVHRDHEVGGSGIKKEGAEVKKKEVGSSSVVEKGKGKGKGIDLDLNLPAPEEDEEEEKP